MDLRHPDPSAPSLANQAEALERLDSGQRLAVVTERELLAVADASVTKASLTPDPDVAEAIHERIGEAQQELASGMKLADLAGDDAVRDRIASFVNELDDFSSVLEERWSS